MRNYYRRCTSDKDYCWFIFDFQKLRGNLYSRFEEPSGYRWYVTNQLFTMNERDMSNINIAQHWNDEKY